MRLVSERLQRIRHPHEIVPTLEGVSRRVPRAAVGVQTRDVESGQPPLRQGALERRVQERAVSLFAEHDVAGLRRESGDDLGVPTACHGMRGALPGAPVRPPVGGTEPPEGSPRAKAGRWGFEKDTAGTQSTPHTRIPPFFLNTAPTTELSSLPHPTPFPLWGCIFFCREGSRRPGGRPGGRSGLPTRLRGGGAPAPGARARRGGGRGGAREVPPACHGRQL